MEDSQTQLSQTSLVVASMSLAMLGDGERTNVTLEALEKQPTAVSIISAANEKLGNKRNAETYSASMLLTIINMAFDMQGIVLTEVPSETMLASLKACFKRRHFYKDEAFEVEAESADMLPNDYPQRPIMEFVDDYMQSITDDQRHHGEEEEDPGYVFSLIKVVVDAYIVHLRDTPDYALMDIDPPE